MVAILIVIALLGFNDVLLLYGFWLVALVGSSLIVRVKSLLLLCGGILWCS